MQTRTACLGSTFRNCLVAALAFGLATLTVSASHAGPLPHCDFPCDLDKLCSVGVSEPQDQCVASPGEEVTYYYQVDLEAGGTVEVWDDQLGFIGVVTSGGTLTRTTTLSETTTNWGSLVASAAHCDCASCYCLSGNLADAVTVTVDDAADCLCEVQNINPNQVVLQNVGSGGKGSDNTRKMVMTFHAVDAPGATCDPGEFSAPTPINLKMEDDRGNILIDSAKTVVCGHGMTTNLKRNVLFQGPLNCENGAVPGGSSTGSITSTGTGSAGTSVYVESTKIKCFE